MWPAVQYPIPHTHRTLAEVLLCPFPGKFCYMGVQAIQYHLKEGVDTLTG